MMNQNLSQPQQREDNPRKMSNPFSKNSQKQDSPNNMGNQSKYSSSRQYQPQRDYRSNNIRERSRSRDIIHRPSFHDHQYNNMNKGNQNNYDLNNQRYKPNYYRSQISDHNNQRLFEPKYNKDKYNNLQNSDGVNHSYNSNDPKDDCLILLPKNYYNFIIEDFDKLKNTLKNELKDDISNIIYNYSVPSFNEKIFKFTTYSISSKSIAIKIISEFLFNALKKLYEKTTYLKLSFLIPDNVIGFIIGIEGKNINQIREETNAKIEVYSPNNSRNYRKIEIAGDPQGIAGAAEKIYSITKRYFYFKNPKQINRNDRDRRDIEHDRDIRDRDFNSYKDRNYGGYRNKDYNNNNNYKDKEYKGMYNKERNEYRDIGYKNEYKNNGGYRNYSNNRDNNRDMRKNSRDYYDNNDGYYRDNYRDYRDNGPRYKNNYDRNNSKYYYDKNKNNNNQDDNVDSKNGDNRSKRSNSRKSFSNYSKDNSYSNDRYYSNNNNDDNEKREWSDDNINNNNLNREDNIEEQKNINSNEENNNKPKLELGEEKEIRVSNNNSNDLNNQNELVNNNNLGNNIYENNENNINKDIDNNNIDENKNNINVDDSVDGKKMETDDINNILVRDVDENDSKLCKINIYLSSEEINLLDTLKNNIWINLENSYQCSISKNMKNIDNQEISLITFNGTPKQNTLALYQLQKYLLETKNIQNNVNKKDN